MPKNLARGKPPSQRSNRLQRLDPFFPDEDDIRFVTIHEAGHAVAAVVLDIKLVTVDVNRRPASDGRVSLGFTKVPLPDARAFAGKGADPAMPFLVQIFAGPLAEIQINPATPWGEGHQGDLHTARKLAAVAMCTPVFAEDGMTVSVEDQQQNSEGIKALLTTAADNAAALVREHWDAIQKVAEALTRRRSLTGAEVAAIVADDV